mmetsp:Transcript_20778/g.40647  ORF Transcript_20778/g.40647 Transcript_20778/m.40647 type:complete len:80 (-) Transcript_20778:19-258(-)
MIHQPALQQLHSKLLSHKTAQQEPAKSLPRPRWRLPSLVIGVVYCITAPAAAATPSKRAASKATRLLHGHINEIFVFKP